MQTAMKTIGGREFGFRTIPATESVVVQVEIASVIGEPLFKALMAAQQDGDEPMTKEKLFALLGSMIGLLTTKLNAKQLVALLETVFKYVSVGNQRVNIDRDFDHQPKEMWLVFWEALRFNYSSFLDGSLFGSDLDKILSE